jgi:hypothetical protein
MTQQQPTPAGALITIRIIWAAMLMGVLTFMGVVLFVIKPSGRPPDAKFTQLLFYIAVGMLCALVPIGLLIRSMIWRRGRGADGSVSPGAYSTGLIIQLATCEGTAFFALVGTMLDGGRGPQLIVAGIAMAVMLLSFPTGRPLRAGDAITPIHHYDSKV